MLVVPCLIALALVGHFAVCVFAINRWHSFPFPRYLLKLGDLFWYAWLGSLPLTLILGWMHDQLGEMLSVRQIELQFVNGASYVPISATYVGICWIAAGWGLIARCVYLCRDATAFRKGEVSCTRRLLRHDLGYIPAGSFLTRAFSHLPGNEIFDLSITHKSIVLPRMPESLTGLSVAHLSDLHLTGQMNKEFYQYVLNRVLELQADLIVVTGDIVEKRRCLAWIPELFPPLNAPLGTYFVLGNHELRIGNSSLIRETLRGAGWVDVGGAMASRVVRRHSVCLAGTELPWFKPASNLRLADSDVWNDASLKIGLSHAPDQLPWARQHGVDLLLAGHTHGGQVRFPLFGPLLSPSRYGVRYASGLFHAPPTVMHVSRGVSGTRPLRWHAPPEITKLTLLASGSAPQRP